MMRVEREEGIEYCVKRGWEKGGKTILGNGNEEVKKMRGVWEGVVTMGRRCEENGRSERT
jgi:hypothetical protein